MIYSFTCLDLTLTLPNMLAALQDVTDWNLLSRLLDIPKSGHVVMSGKESMLQQWLQTHPNPSWKLVAWALYVSGGGMFNEHSILKQLYGTRVAGMWLCNQAMIIVIGSKKSGHFMCIPILQYRAKLENGSYACIPYML